MYRYVDIYIRIHHMCAYILFRVTSHMCIYIVVERDLYERHAQRRLVLYHTNTHTPTRIHATYIVVERDLYERKNVCFHLDKRQKTHAVCSSVEVCCSMLQCVAVRCSVVQCDAVRCSVHAKTHAVCRSVL